MQINEIRSHHGVASTDARAKTCHCDITTIMKVALTILLIGAAAVATVYFLTPLIGLVYAITATICTPIILSIIALALSKLCGKEVINKHEKIESSHEINPPLEQREMESKHGHEIHRYNPQEKEQIRVLEMHMELIRIHEEELAEEARVRKEYKARYQEQEKQEEIEQQRNLKRQEAEFEMSQNQPAFKIDDEQQEKMAAIKHQAKFLAKRAMQDLVAHQQGH